MQKIRRNDLMLNVPLIVGWKIARPNEYAQCVNSAEFGHNGNDILSKYIRDAPKMNPAHVEMYVLFVVSLWSKIPIKYLYCQQSEAEQLAIEYINTHNWTMQIIDNTYDNKIHQRWVMKWLPSLLNV